MKQKQEEEMVTRYRGWVIRPKGKGVELAFKSFSENSPVESESLEQAKKDIDWIEAAGKKQGRT